MKIYVETLKRLLNLGQLKEEKIKELFDKNKITKEEYNYIIKK